MIFEININLLSEILASIISTGIQISQLFDDFYMLGNLERGTLELRREVCTMTNHNNHTPIPWREWDDAAFEEARALDRPILLDIGAVWCHWCHVMDDGIPGDPMHTGTYINDEVKQRIADHFIPIKVDNDRRPDINARYNMGGWPSTVFLNPNGEILYGETYVHPERMISLLDYIADFYTNKKDQLSAQTEDIRARRAETEATTLQSIDPETSAEVAASLNRNFDAVYGGFGKEPKFPHPAALLFAIERSVTYGDKQMRIIVERTLEGMAGGGMYDKYAGGFFRYSTTRDWSVPHFEKMLEDNARLIAVYAASAAAFDDDKYIKVADSVRGWLVDVMLNSVTGMFSGSQDADEEERYYGEPLDIRATMPTPYIDPTVYCSWNALAISGFTRSYQVAGDASLLATAIKGYDFLKQRLTHINGDATDWNAALTTQRYLSNNVPEGTKALLVDQTEFANAALTLYETTSEPAYLLDAAHAANTIVDTLIADSGGFMDVAPLPDAIGELARPSIELQENSEAALMLLRLSTITGIPKYRLAAEKALTYFADSYRKSGYFAASYARAIEALTGPSPHIVVVGSKEKIREIQAAAWKLIVPGKTVETVFSDASNSVISSPESIITTLPRSGEPKAYVCIGDRCLAPVSDPEALKSLVLNLYQPKP